MTVRGAPRVSRNATVARCALATTRPLIHKGHAHVVSSRALFFLVPLIVLAACSSDSDQSGIDDRNRLAPSATGATTVPAVAETTEATSRHDHADLAGRSRRAIPRRPLRGQQGCRHDQLPVGFRLLRLGLDRRCAGRQAEGLLRGSVPRRQREAQLLDRQLSTDRRQRGTVLLRRIVQRGRRLRRPQRRRVRRPRRRRSNGHRRADRQGRAEHRAQPTSRARPSASREPSRPRSRRC